MAEGLIGVGAKTEVAYVSGDIFATNFTAKRDGAIRIGIAVSAAVKLTFDNETTQLPFNSDVALTANALHTFTWLITAGEVYNFQLSGAATIRRMVVQEAYGDSL